jgi:hypothetical protein
MKGRVVSIDSFCRVPRAIEDDELFWHFFWGHRGEVSRVVAGVENTGTRSKQGVEVVLVAEPFPSNF